MKLFDRLRGAIEHRANDPSWNALSGASPGTAGQHVDARSAESITAVFGCVQALSESSATLPLHTYRRSDDGDRLRADDHWLSRLLDRPNEWQTGMDFRESQTASVLLTGNAYARKEVNGRGEVTALHPLHPQRVTIVRLSNGRYRYDYSEDGKLTPLLADEVFHLRDRTDPGSIVGKSRIRIARETLGLTLALRQHGANVFSRGARPSAVLINEGTRDPNTEQLREMQQRLEYFASPANAGRVMQLPRGIKWQSVGLSNEDSEWLSAMQYGVQDVCRLYRVPPVLVQDLSHATFTNVLELGQQFVRFSLQRWLTMWEETISAQLLGPLSRRNYYVEHSLEGLLRSSSKDRSEFYGNAIRDGWMDVEEVRRLENLPRRDATTPQDRKKSPQPE